MTLLGKAMLGPNFTATPFLALLPRRSAALLLVLGLFALTGCDGSSGGANPSGESTGGENGRGESTGGANPSVMGGGHAAPGGGEPAGAAGMPVGEGGTGQAGAGGEISIAGAGGQGGSSCVVKTLHADINATTNTDLQALAGVTDLTGYLSLSAGITDLSPLSCLAHVSGNVALRNLTTLAAFAPPQLTSIGGALIVADDAQLIRVVLPGLTKLGSDVGRSLWLENLPMFTNLDVRLVTAVPADVFLDGFGDSGHAPSFDLSSLSSIGGSLSLTGMHLTNVDAFLPLRTIKGSLLIRSGDIPDLRGLRGITGIGRGLTISATTATKVDLGSLSQLGNGKSDVCTVDNLPRLASLTVGKLPKAACDVTLIDLGAAAAGPLQLDFGSLTTVDAGLRLSRVANLGNLAAFAKLATISGRLLVGENSALESAALPALTLAQGSLGIESNDALTAVSLPLLTTVAGDFRLVHLVRLRRADAPALSSVVTATLSEQGILSNAPLTLHFDSLSKVAQDMALTSLIGLADLSGFQNLAEVGGNLGASGNANLSTFSLPTLTKVGKHLRIIDDAALTTISLPLLVSVGSQDGASFSASLLPALTALDLPQLAAVPADLNLTSISSNSAPLSLGFTKLITVGGTLRLQTSRGLSTLSGLGALTTVSGSLNIKDNDALPTCQATALVTRLASSISGSFVAGNLPDSCSN